MDFEQVVSDIQGMIGLRLRSIRSGAELIVTDVDRNEQRLLIASASGRECSRPFSHLRQIWTALSTQPAVHVESALKGSGSSRNQPETIIANLPYVEWFRFRGKKHLVYVGEPTHPLGTLRELSPDRASAISARLEQGGTTSPRATMVIVTESPGHFAAEIAAATGVPIAVCEEATFKYRIGDCAVIVVRDSHVPLEPGSYLALQTPMAASTTQQVVLDGVTYSVNARGGTRFLVYSASDDGR